MKTKNLVNEVSEIEVILSEEPETVESLKAEIARLKLREKELKEKSKSERKAIFTRPQAVGYILAKYPEGKTEEELITLANDYFTEITGKAKNEKETRWLFGYAKNFLKGYGRK